MQIIETLDGLTEFQNSLEGKTVALVPTMGALHDGHMALVREGLSVADVCLPYIYLNPTQFAEGEDLDQYPKTLQEDLDKLESAGAEFVWLPTTEDVYPNGVQAHLKAGALSKPLEGESRPHFFDGVVSVVARMFELSKPDVAIFGEKDFQQLQVIKHMVAVENFDVKIIGSPTVRDRNGLALSSRNVYLNKTEYETAVELNKVLIQLAQNMVTEKEAKQLLLYSGFDKVDYCVQRNSETFEADNADRVLAAAWIGKTRLIDNFAMGA